MNESVLPSGDIWNPERSGLRKKSRSGMRLARAGAAAAEDMRTGPVGGMATEVKSWLGGRVSISRQALSFGRRAQIFGHSRADVGHEQLLDLHRPPREFLLVEMADQRLESRSAAFDRIIPNLRSENFPRCLKFINDPGQTDRQRVGVVHPVIGDVAGARERAVEADGEPWIGFVERGLEHEGEIGR